MASILRVRLPALSATPRPLTAECVRTFQSSAPSFAAPKKPAKGMAGKRVHRQSGSFTNKNKKGQSKDSSSPGPRRADAYGIVKLDHPLFKVEEATKPLPTFNPAELTEHSVGTPVSFPNDKTSVIPFFGLPKSMEQENRLTSSPFSIIRKSTLDVLDKLDQCGTGSQPKSPASKADSSSKSAGPSAIAERTNRFVITGPAGSGKSVLLLQAANYCALNGWIVYYVPYGISWVNSSTPYTYDYRSQLFHQHALAAEALSKILTFNQAKISKLRVMGDLPIPGGRAGAILKAGSPLETLAQYGIKDPSVAPQTLVLLFEQLGKQTEYPLLVAIDDFQALYSTTLYRDPQFKPVNSYHLSMPRLIMEYASGKRTIARGALLGATSNSNTTFPINDSLRSALQLEWEGGRMPTAYDRQRKSFAPFAEGLQSIPIPEKFSTPEAAALMETWSKNRHNTHYGNPFGQPLSMYQQQQQLHTQPQPVAHFQSSHQNHANVQGGALAGAAMLSNNNGSLMGVTGGMLGIPNGAGQTAQQMAHEEGKIYALVIELMDPSTRESALLELSKKREHYDDLALVLWHSFGIMAALLQEIVSVYALLSPPTLTAQASNRVCNALALLQCVASHPETRQPFLNAHIPLFLYPFLNTTSKTRPFEYLRLTSLGVIGALVKQNDNNAVIHFLLSTEIIPLCLRIMETGSELSKTVAIFIVQKILLDETGLTYICHTYERFYAVGTVLSNMVTQLVETQTVRLLKHVVRCYLRLSDNLRAREALRACLPEPLRDNTFSNLLKGDMVTKRCLSTLLINLSEPPPM
ncbi:hypothetical protein FRB99_004913 [Tulasnella sp. 403]|nr:hypothetical protein FRB99_004913 [Tulasnella sp. 403]